VANEIKRKNPRHTGVLLSFSSDINMPEIGKSTQWADHINKLEQMRRLLENQIVQAEEIMKGNDQFLVVNNGTILAKKGQAVYYYDNGAQYGIASADSNAATHIVSKLVGNRAYLTVVANDTEVSVNPGDGTNATPLFWLYLNGNVTDDYSKIANANGVPQNGCIYAQVIGTRLSSPNDSGRSRCTVSIQQPLSI